MLILSYPPALCFSNDLEPNLRALASFQRYYMVKSCVAVAYPGKCTSSYSCQLVFVHAESLHVILDILSLFGPAEELFGMHLLLIGYFITA